MGQRTVEAIQYAIRCAERARADLAAVSGVDFETAAKLQRRAKREIFNGAHALQALDNEHEAESNDIDADDDCEIDDGS